MPFSDDVFISAGVEFGFGHEAKFGSKAELTKSFGILNQSITLPDLSRDVRTYRSFGSGRGQWQSIKEGRHDHRTTLSITPTNPSFLYPAFGAISGAGTSGDPYLITPKALPPVRSLTMGAYLKQTDGNFLRTFTGGCIDDLNVSAQEGSEVQVSMGTIFQDVDDDEIEDAASGTQGDLSFTTPTPDGEAYMYYDTGGYISIAGQDFARVTSWSWGTRNNLKTHYFFRRNDTTAIDDPVTVTNGSAVVTDIADTSGLVAGDRVRFDSQGTFYNVLTVDSGTQITLTTTYKGATGTPALSRVDVPPQKIALVTPGYMDFSLEMSMVPANHYGGGADDIYSLLKSGSTFNVSLPVRQSATNSYTTTFTDCMVRTAPHALNESGNEVVSNVSFVPRKITTSAVYDGGIP